MKKVFDRMGVAWERRYNTALQTRVLFAQVDCAADKVLCRDQLVETYPTIHHYHKGKRVATLDATHDPAKFVKLLKQSVSKIEEPMPVSTSQSPDLLSTTAREAGGKAVFQAGLEARSRPSGAQQGHEGIPQTEVRGGTELQPQQGSLHVQQQLQGGAPLTTTRKEPADIAKPHRPDAASCAAFGSSAEQARAAPLPRVTRFSLKSGEGSRRSTGLVEV